jgi:alpha-galactosidase
MAIRYPAGFIIMVALLLGSCGRTGNTDEPVLKIEHGNLVMEVNREMKTRLTSTLPGAKPLMDSFQATEKLQAAGRELGSFDFEKVTESEVMGPVPGKEWTVEGSFADAGLKIHKVLTIRAYQDFPDLVSTRVSYTNTSAEDIFVEAWANNAYTVLSQGESPPFWAFQGSSSESRSDWVRPLEAGYYDKNYLGMNATDYGGGIPVTSVWRKDANVAVGHLAMVPKLVSLPTEITDTRLDVKIGVRDDFDARTRLKANDTLQTLETFVSVSKGDYFENLSRYSRLMQAKGITMAAPEEAAFEPVWCAWGYERQFTLREIIGTLPKVKELGFKWAVLDDGFQIAEGDWNANPDKFPGGNEEIKDLVDKIHSYGLKAKIWWTPLAADPGSKVLREHPDSKVTRQDGSPQFISWWDAYYLSPTKEATRAHTRETIRLFMDTWGFDGLKMDGQHMNAVAPDYSLDNPVKSSEGVPDFFHMIYDEARQIKPHAVVENCPCGTCMSYFNMAYMNQAVSSDPLSSWQIRHKGKTYKALVPHTAYYGDHVELSDGADDFASSFGVGAVLGTKFTWPKDNPAASDSYLLTPEKEQKWKKWITLYNAMMLSKADYLGELYDIGYDKPETHAIRKGGRMYYAFYAESWDAPVQFRGLKSDTSYKVRDYFNDTDLGEITGNNPTLQVTFDNFLLLEVSPQ